MKRMLVNLREPEENRAVIVDGDKLLDLHIERTGRPTLAGNVYRGRVVNIEAGIQAAFVDIGEDSKGFLHGSDVVGAALAMARGTQAGAPSGDPSGPIQAVLRKGMELPVQVSKDGIGRKGPSLTCQISLPGRYLVAMPFMPKRGVSRKIEEDAERERLKTLLDSMELPGGMGFIVRTAGMDRKKTELERDLKYLKRVWDSISELMTRGEGPALLYRESEFVVRTMRDFFATDVEEVLIDTEDGCGKAREFFSMAMPRYEARVSLYRDDEPIFGRFRVEQRISEVFERKVPLKSGGSIVIDPTEAVTAIDVNSGRFTAGADAEANALATNLEAAPEVARQVMLRDLGGLVVVDFIDMKKEASRRAVEKAFKDAMRADRSRHSILRMSRFCLVEMTRQRVRSALATVNFDPCASCGGTGRVLNIESLCARILRKARAALSREEAVLVEILAAPRTASWLNNQKRARIAELEASARREIRVIGREGIPDDFEIRAYAEGGRQIRL